MREFPKNLFPEQKLKYTFNLNTLDNSKQESPLPLFPEGEVILTTFSCDIQENGYNPLATYKKIIFVFEDERHVQLLQTFYINDGCNANLAKLVQGILGEAPEGDFDMKTLLIGKKFIADICHFYTKEGVLYCNIGSCRKIQI